MAHAVASAHVCATSLTEAPLRVSVVSGNDVGGEFGEIDWAEHGNKGNQVIHRHATLGACEQIRPLAIPLPFGQDPYLKRGLADHLYTKHLHYQLLNPPTCFHSQVHDHTINHWLVINMSGILAKYIAKKVLGESAQNRFGTEVRSLWIAILSTLQAFVSTVGMNSTGGIISNMFCSGSIL